MSACTNLINSVSTTLHVYVPMRRHGTDCVHVRSMGGIVIREVRGCTHICVRLMVGIDTTQYLQ